MAAIPHLYVHVQMCARKRIPPVIYSFIYLFGQDGRAKNKLCATYFKALRFSLDQILCFDILTALIGCLILVPLSAGKALTGGLVSPL